MADQVHLPRELDRIVACGNLVEAAGLHELDLPPEVVRQIGATIQNIALLIKAAAADGSLIYRRPDRD
jgi:hypothetical protein